MCIARDVSCDRAQEACSTFRLQGVCTLRTGGWLCRSMFFQARVHGAADGCRDAAYCASDCFEHCLNGADC